MTRFTGAAVITGGSSGPGFPQTAPRISGSAFPSSRESACAPGDTALAAGGQQAVIKPGPLRPAVRGGFTIDDFAADHAAGTVTCSAGITRHVTRTRAVTFGAAYRGCPLRQQCTTAKGGRALTLHEHDALLHTARAEWPAIRSPQPPQPHRRGLTRHDGTWLLAT